MVTQDKSCKSSVKTKQKPKKKKKKIKECKEWQLVLPIKKKTVNHFTTRKWYEKPFESEHGHGCSKLLEL